MTRMLLRSNKWLSPNDSFTFLHRHDLIRGHRREAFHLSILPAYRDLGRRGFTYPEVKAKVALRHEGTPAAHFSNLLMFPGGDSSSSADSVGAGDRNQPDQQRVARAWSEVLEQRRRLIQVHNNDFHIAIIVEIANRKPA